ncbi:MAG: beta-ketoacyl-[acyl-carrier-protein] synthase II [Lysobacteraceae bacterium]|nr:MAG: beta-ketoacyl-[acyl-carrier-protein] synthase II [Xanthomonadaceae bacterium]
MTKRLYLSRPSLICALGNGLESCAASLFADQRPAALRPHEGFLVDRSPWLGCIDPSQELPLLEDVPVQFRSRNNQLLAALIEPLRPVLEAALNRYGPDRVAIVIGTSTSGIAESERALLSPSPDYHYAKQEMAQPAQFLQHYLGTRGPAYVVSTACASSAMAIAAGSRLIRCGFADVALVGGADTLCRFTVAGFAALESLSSGLSMPFSRSRDGINIGEGGALFLLGPDEGPVLLAGYGESSDAYHMSAPDPSGCGALAAMKGAILDASLALDQIDYINLHGTGTPLNDQMEAIAITRLGAASVPCSSTKPLTGHALGAAGAIEAAICWLVLADNPGRYLPPHWYDGGYDPDLPPLALVEPRGQCARPPRHVLSNSFAFGGSNVCLALSAA